MREHDRNVVPRGNSLRGVSEQERMVRVDNIWNKLRDRLRKKSWQGHCHGKITSVELLECRDPNDIDFRIRHRFEFRSDNKCSMAE